MDSQVQRDDDPRDRSLAMQLREAQERRRGMVVYVQELEWLLLQNQENGIQELPELEPVVDDVECLQPRSPCGLVADTIEESTPAENRDDLLEHDGQEQARPERECQVVDQKGDLKALSKRLPTLHELSPSKDDGEVGDDGCRD